MLNGHPKTNQELSTTMQGAAEAWRTMIIKSNPDGDWNPLFITQTHDLRCHIPPLPPELINTDNGKETLCMAIGDLASHEDVIRVGLLLSSFQSVVKPYADGTMPDVADVPRPRDDINRVEQLTIHIVDHASSDSWRAEIMRAPGMPPILAPWKSFGDAAITSGRFPEAMMRVRESRSTGQILAEIMS